MVLYATIVARTNLMSLPARGLVAVAGGEIL
jgi:hypothetical protein